MANEDAYNAAKNAYRMYGAFFNAVAKEIGLEHALMLNAKYGETSGRRWAERLKEADLKEVAESMKEGYERAGQASEIEVSPTELIYKVYTCPRYDGFQAAGLDHETIKAVCRRTNDVVNATLKKHVPNASMKMTKFCVSPDDFCQAEILIKQPE